MERHICALNVTMARNDSIDRRHTSRSPLQLYVYPLSFVDQRYLASRLRAAIIPFNRGAISVLYPRRRIADGDTETVTSMAKPPVRQALPSLLAT